MTLFPGSLIFRGGEEVRPQGVRPWEYNAIALVTIRSYWVHIFAIFSIIFLVFLYLLSSSLLLLLSNFVKNRKINQILH